MNDMKSEKPLAAIKYCLLKWAGEPTSQLEGKQKKNLSRNLVEISSLKKANKKVKIPQTKTKNAVHSKTEQKKDSTEC